MIAATDIRPRHQYAGRSGPMREVLEVNGDCVVYAVGTSYGSRESECSVTTFRKWATGPGSVPYSALKKARLPFDD